VYHADYEGALKTTLVTFLRARLESRIGFEVCRVPSDPNASVMDMVAALSRDATWQPLKGDEALRSSLAALALGIAP
jgi:hypothetical protein